MCAYPTLRKAGVKHARPQQHQQQQQHLQQQQELQRQLFIMPETDIALVVGRAAWWKPIISNGISSNSNNNNTTNINSSKRLQKLPSFADTLKDFLRNVSFHCYSKLVEQNRRFEERFFWLVFHVTALSVLITFLWNHYDNERPALSTTIFNQLYPVEKVAFPAISICSINRISNASIIRYSEMLHEKDPYNRGAAYFYRNLHFLDVLYNREDDANLDVLLNFQGFLDIYDTDDFELYYNTRKIMHLITPDCKQTVVQCRLAGVEVDCSAEFVQSLTSEGFCCTFNVDGRYSEKRRSSLQFFGSDRGLQVLLNGSMHDYFYQYHRVHGFKVLLYIPSNQPQISSSGVNVYLAQTYFDTHLKIQPTILEAVREIRHLHPKVRNCLFENELKKEFPDGYSYNKCITRCRTYSILALCQCVNFQSPYEQLQMSSPPIYCTLRHQQCLRRYRFKWLNVITKRQFVEGLEREMEDSLYCPDCLPSCSETTYEVNVMGQPLNVYNLRSYPHEFRDDVINNNDNNTDLALLSVYFAIPHAQYFKQILKYSWFEVFSNIGGICGIITGFSLIGIGEVIFFLVKQLYAAFKDEMLEERSVEQTQRITKKVEPLFILP